MRQADDPHPMRMSQAEDDVGAVKVANAALIDSAQHFSQMLVATSGEMALLQTIAPNAFVRLKNLIAQSPQRDPLKRPKDVLQAQIVQALIDGYMPQFAG